METSSRKCRLKIIKKTLVISKWTEKRHLILQNSDLDFYIASNGVALKADFEKSYFLPTVQIKDEKKDIPLMFIVATSQLMTNWLENML